MGDAPPPRGLAKVIQLPPLKIMRATTLAAASTLAVLGCLAPSSASALTFTAPLLAGSTTTLTNTPQNILFNGTSTFPVPAGYTLSTATLTIAGTTGGNFKASNPLSGTPATLASSQNFSLQANLQTSPGYTNNITPISPSTFTIPGASSPGGIYTFGMANYNLVVTPQVLTWTIWNTTSIGGGAAPAGDPSFFTNATPQPKSLPVNTFFQIASTPPGAFINTGDNASTLGINLAGSFVTYTFVPGPLPVLGAGAAFGWSRRLRRRISQTA
jgi:hypothetical protein